MEMKTDYSALINALRDERTWLGCNDDEVSGRLYDMLGRITDTLVQHQQDQPETIYGGPSSIYPGHDENDTLTGPLTVSPVIADVLRAADQARDFGGSHEVALIFRSAVDAWRAAGRPGV